MSRRGRLLFDKAPIALYELDLHETWQWLAARDLIGHPDRVAALPQADLDEALQKIAIVDVNQAALRYAGTTREDIVGSGVNVINRTALLPLVAQLARGERELEHEAIYNIGGIDRIMAMRVELPDNPAELRGVVASLRDVTEERRAAEAMHAAQRLESIALLAGSVAHDFNNLLTVVRMSADRLAQRVPGAEGKELDRMRDATARAAVLTRQLLLFGKRDIAQRQVFVPGDVVAALEPVWRREIDPRIAFTFERDDRTCHVELDPGQFEQLMRNLVVNAADAMPTGGKLTISRELTTTHVTFAIADTGVGMTDEVRLQAFEPFFTTRPGKRAGLGLAICRDIARAAGGDVTIADSAVGSRVEVVLPCVTAPASVTANLPIFGTERVLLVEDEAGVREVARLTLEEAGYSVTAVENGEAALAEFWRSAQVGAGIDVVVSDLVMPGLGGRELVDRLRATRPTLPVLYVSGFAADGPPVLDDGTRIGFLAKPFTSAQLLRSVRAVLPK